MTDPNKEFLRKLQATFRAEAEEHLREVISNTVLLEQASGDAQGEFIQRILKTLHTFKGAARAVDNGELQTLCHALEGVFSTAMESGRALAPDQFDAIHQASSLARLLANEPTGKSRNQALALIARLDRLSAELLVAGKRDRPVPLTGVIEADAGDDAGNPVHLDLPETVKSDVIRVRGKDLDAIRYQAEELLSVELQLNDHIASLIDIADQMADRCKRGAESGIHRAHAGGGVRGRMECDSDAPEAQCRRLADSLSKTRRNFLAIRSKLMDSTLKTALAPFSSALDQLPGLLRNLARSQGKEALLSIEGEDVQVDRRVLDIAREALMHLVTNAVGHGIEPVERRLAAGKPSAGMVRISALLRATNEVAITVSDDGAGIDVGALANAAAKGAASADQAAQLENLHGLRLALRAGVSTSVEVTKVSGRGMGLAIVADKVASAGGSLVIENSSGAGCSFELRLPVRLATLRGLVLRTGSARYVLPVSGIDAVRTLKSGDIQTVENRETLLVGQRVAPVVRLGPLLGIRRSAGLQNEGVALIAHAGGNTFALLVDEIVSEQEVLPKSLGKQLRRVRCVTGATQLGDGSLVLILGLEDIAMLGLATGAAAVSLSPKPITPIASKRVLVVEDSITSRLLLKHILEGAGYQVRTAEDGLDALSKLRHEDFDAVVSDIEMPRMDGIALTESIRANPRMEHMAVVLVTSLQSPDEKELGLRAGADAYIVKGSFDQDSLLATIRRLI